ncbi:MAG: flagellar filament capping protein FliD [Steroidobacteraceae bacterium]
MATTTSSISGGSQIDVASLAAQLVAAERAPLDAAITRETTRVTTQISAVGSLMGALSTFRSSLSSLKTTDVFAARSATSGDEKKFTAAATSKAVSGTYDVEVQKLAKAQQISSGAFANGSSQVVGTGTLTLSLGASSFNVTIDSENSTLAEVRDAINAASDNPGVRATLINASDGAHLVLTSNKTGAASTIAISQTGGDGGLAQLAYSSGSPGNYRELAPAQDAVVMVGGYQATSSTNIVEGAIDGVTLNLTGVTEEDTTVSLTVGYDNTAVTNRIKTFVSAYNTLRTQMSKLSSYDATTQTAGAMLGDSMLTSIDEQVRRALSTAVPEGGKYQTLASLGITTQADGSLAIDEAKLTKALDNDFDGVAKLFGSEKGIAATLYKQVDDRLAATGGLQSRSETLVKSQKTLADRKADVDARMLVVQKQYVKQFTALDTLLSSLSTTSSFLTQQLDSLANLRD